MPINPKSIRENRYKIAFFAFLAIGLIRNLYVLFRFNFLFADEDQTLLWVVFRDFLEGKWLSPTFYGNNYASALDAWIAACVAWFFPQSTWLPYYWLPTISSVLFSFPWIAIGALRARRGQCQTSLIPLAIWSVLPASYTAFVQMPRGIEPGVFLGGIAWLALESLGISSSGLFLSSLFLGLGLFMNKGVAFVAIPILAGLYFEKRHKELSLQSIASIAGGIGVAAFYPICVWWFYHKHPEWLVHTEPRPRFMLVNLVNSLRNLPDYFSLYDLVERGSGILCVSAAAFWIYRGVGTPQKRALYIFLVISFLFLATSKSRDGSISLYFPLGRFFLATPFLALYLARGASTQHQERILFSFFALGLIQLPMLPWEIKRAQELANSKPLQVVDVMPVEAILSQCAKYEAAASRCNAQATWVNLQLVIAYGCNSVGLKRTETMAWGHPDRRGWLSAKPIVTPPFYALWIDDEKTCDHLKSEDAIRCFQPRESMSGTYCIEAKTATHWSTALESLSPEGKPGVSSTQFNQVLERSVR